MTMHSSKGMEFDHVIVCINPWVDLSSEEEFRVTYVALTRTKNALDIILPDRSEYKSENKRTVIDSILSYNGVI